MLGFNLSDRYVVVLNFLLVGTIVYFLANSVVDVMSLRLAGSILPVQTETAPSARAARRAPGMLARASYEPIITRDIFNLAPAPEVAPAATSEDLEIKLLGTSHLTTGKPFVIVEDATGNQSLYRLGDSIPNVGRLMEVGHDKAVVLHNGHRVALSIPSEDDQGAGAIAQSPLRRRPPFFRGSMGPSMIRPGLRPQILPGAGIHRVAPNRYVLDRSTVDGNLQNMSKLFTEIRAVPNLQNGTSNGFRLSEIESGSIFDKIGLKDGDVLTSVGGQPVNDPGKAIALLPTLRSSSSISLTVMRNGAPMQFYYNIR